MPMKNFYNMLNNLSIGDRIIVPKSLFNLVQHHAVYLGKENGLHYIIENKEMIGVQVVTAEQFFNGVQQITRIEHFTPTYNYTRKHLLRRALALVGTKYHLTKYNCEHFANDVINGQRNSKQIETAQNFTTLAATVILAVGLLGGYK